MKLNNIVFIFVVFIFVLLTIQCVLSTEGNFLVVESENNFNLVQGIFGNYDLGNIYCGNGVKDGSEGCDGVDYGVYTGTCLNYNVIYSSGNLACSATCVIDTSACVLVVAPGGGGGGGATPASTTTFNIYNFNHTTSLTYDDVVSGGKEQHDFIITNNASFAQEITLSCKSSPDVCQDVSFRETTFNLNSQESVKSFFVLDKINFLGGQTYVVRILANSSLQGSKEITYYFNTQEQMTLYEEMAYPVFNIIPFLIILILLAIIITYAVRRYTYQFPRMTKNKRNMITFSTFIISLLLIHVIVWDFFPNQRTFLCNISGGCIKETLNKYGNGDNYGFRLTDVNGNNNRIYNNIQLTDKQTLNFILYNTMNKSQQFTFSCEGTNNICNYMVIDKIYPLLPSNTSFQNFAVVDTTKLKFGTNYVLNIIASNGQNVIGITYYLNTIKVNRFTALYFGFLPFVLVCLLLAFLVSYTLKKVLNKTLRTKILVVISFIVTFLLCFLLLPVT